MNNTFSLSRFGKYFVYDIKQCYNKVGISVAVTAASPIISFIVFQIFWLILEGQFALNHQGMDITRVILAMVFVITIIIVSPSRLYGQITDKRFGSNYLLVPASGFEKFLSMFLIAVIIVPVVAFALIIGVDGIMSAIFPHSYGPWAINAIADMFDTAQDVSEYINMPLLMSLGVANNVLTYLLGAIIFKKSKIAKTILACFCIGLFFMLILSLFFNIFNPELYINNDGLEFVTNINYFAYILTIAQIVILALATFFRIKTIQH